MPDITCTLLVIGAGPGGYVCAIRAGQLGIDTVIVEAGALGGTCLNVGCIPSKALLHAADEYARVTHPAHHAALGITTSAATINFGTTAAWIRSIVDRLGGGIGTLLERAGVRHIKGIARFRDGKTVLVKTENRERRIRAEHIVIATGAEPVALPGIPFGGDVISSSEALSLAAIPRRLAVIGAGYIGLEIGTAYAKLGSEVTVIEAADHVLPQFDRVLTAPVARRLEAMGVTVFTATKAETWSSETLSLVNSDGRTLSLATDKVLVAIGRRPQTSSVELSALGIAMDGPVIRVDERCRTSMRGVFAIGDVTGEPMLAHRAMAQGELVARVVAGHTAAWDRLAVPAICFTDPEIISVGQSADEARASGVDVLISEFPFKANGRALTDGRDDGFVRTIARQGDGLLLGFQAVGHGVSELSAAFSLAFEMGACLDDVAETIHAHPTRSEALHEACLKALGRPIHS